MEDYSSLLSAADPETIKAMVDAGLIDARTALAGRQMAVGNEMMQTPSAQGQHVGGTYVASSPLEHLSVALTRGIGANKLNTAMGQQQDLINQRGQAMGQGWQQILDAMKRRQQTQAQAPQQADPAGGFGGLGVGMDPNLT